LKQPNFRNLMGEVIIDIGIARVDFQNQVGGGSTLQLLLFARHRLPVIDVEAIIVPLSSGSSIVTGVKASYSPSMI